jgi:hypothetical protein
MRISMKNFKYKGVEEGSAFALFTQPAAKWPSGSNAERFANHPIKKEAKAKEN